MIKFLKKNIIIIAMLMISGITLAFAPGKKSDNDNSTPETPVSVMITEDNRLNLVMDSFNTVRFTDVEIPQEEETETAVSEEQTVEETETPVEEETQEAAAPSYVIPCTDEDYNNFLKIKEFDEAGLGALAAKCGVDARTYFYDHENITPLEDLEKYFSEKYQKKVELVPKENHETVVYDVPNNTVLVKTSEVLIGITNSETKEELYKKIEELKKEIINNLSYIPGIKNDYAFYNSLYNQIVKKVYNRDINEIIDTLNNRKDIPIKVCSLISIMPKKHLTYFYKALEELNNYIISKRNIVNSNVVNSLYDMAVSNGVKVYDTIKKESKTTPYKDLVSEVKKGGKR